MRAHTAGTERPAAHSPRPGGTAAAPAGPAAARPGPDLYRNARAALRPALVAALGFSAAVNALMLTGSIYMLQVYDRVLASGSLATLLALFAIVVVLHGFLGLYDFLRTRILARAAARLDATLGEPAFRAWIAAGVPGHGAQRLEIGEAAERARPLAHLETVRGFLSSPAATGLMDVPWVPLFLGVLFLVHPWLGWATLAGAGVVAGLAAFGRWRAREPIGTAMAGEAAARDFAEAGRQAGEAVLAMGMTGAVTGRWRGLQTAALVAAQRAADPSEAIAAASKAFRLLLQSAILTLGAVLVLRQEISAGMIIAASILSGRALAPVDQVIGQWRGIARAAEAHRRLGAFFADLPDARPRIALPPPTGQITAAGLTKYAPLQPRSDRTRILAGVSFTLEPGDGLGVIGNSAAGKSTLARLIAGAWTPDAGEIRFDGATPDQWDPAVLGRHIGYLPQALDLMPGTVRDVIARFDPAIGDAAVIEAAEAVGVHAMILALPDGYATRVGGGAGTTPLSGGQIQRLGLARAVCGWPKIVVLDEPNANLDVAGDEALSRAIAALRARGSTVIVMAHRPSAIAAVNKVLILHAGRVAQFGDKAAVLDAAAAAAAAPGVSASDVPAAATQPAGPPPAGGKTAKAARAVPPGRARAEERAIGPEVSGGIAATAPAAILRLTDPLLPPPDRSPPGDPATAPAAGAADAVPDAAPQTAAGTGGTAASRRDGPAGGGPEPAAPPAARPGGVPPRVATRMRVLATGSGRPVRLFRRSRDGEGPA